MNLAKLDQPTEADCAHPYPVDIKSFSDPNPVGLCTGCGQQMSRDNRGRWVIAKVASVTEGDQTPGEGPP